ncbi:MAG: hypothetical protein SGJ27_21880 [Candidatus Melainabacteria bacterium]|nr:hypothetical protein [Candidatus Melainabacteria bacterium]
MQAKSTNKKRASGAQEQGSTTQESFTTKYGPVTIHQSGVIAKELAATPVKDKETSFALANVRISMHLERFDSTEKLSVEMLCVTRFPEFSLELKHKAPCEMRAGQTHGAAVVQATAISVDFEKGHDTTMEVEYFLGEESLCATSIPIKFPEGSEQAERSAQLQSTAQ